MHIPKPSFATILPLNLALSLAAFWYDWTALQTLPPWAIPFIAICPLYPLILLISWKKPTTTWLLATPVAALGLVALIFYSVTGYRDHSLGWALAQLLWVWLYAWQAWYLLRRHSYRPGLHLAGCLWTTATLFVLMITDSYGYLAINLLKPDEQIGLLILGTTTACLLPLLKRGTPRS